MFLNVQKWLCKNSQKVQDDGFSSVCLNCLRAMLHFANPSSQRNTHWSIKCFWTCKNTNGSQKTSEVIYRNLLFISRRGNLEWYSSAIWSGYNGSCLDSPITYLNLFPPHEIVSFQRRWVWTNMNVSCKRKLSVTDVVNTGLSLSGTIEWWAKRKMRILCIHKSVNSSSHRSRKINSLA